jgi:hypothetical protein
MRHSIVALATAAALGIAALATPAFAASVKYAAQLVASEEVPPTDSMGTGSVDATYDEDSKVLSWTIEYDGLTGPATAAHFHGPADPGANAPPVVPINGDLAAPIQGEATLTDEQYADLKAGKWYFNIHTDKYPDGEIRGQLAAAQ